MKRSIKKVAATVLASVTMFSALATTSNAYADYAYVGQQLIILRTGLFSYHTFMVGDCNGDDQITIADLVLLTGVAPQHKKIYPIITNRTWELCDCNCDNVVDERDVECLRNYLMR